MTAFAHQRFLPAIKDLNALLAKGRYQKDKGVSFYANKARNPLFNLEALCRLYKNIHDKKFFDKWAKEFKVLEDLLGVMDHNESLWIEFSNYKELKKSASDQLFSKFTEAAAKVSARLNADGWISGEKMKAFEMGLMEVKWKEEQEDAYLYGSEMCEELDKLVDKYRDGELDPANLEDGLHEFRRKLRWISIYAQTANGLVQLRKTQSIPVAFSKYSTGEIVNSPFNILPKQIKGQSTITIQSHYFFAMSWLIRYISELKDTGLRSQAFNDLCTNAKVDRKKFSQRFAESCIFDPADIPTLAETAIDDFVYTDFVPERICRDIMRSFQ